MAFSMFRKNSIASACLLTLVAWGPLCHAALGDRPLPAPATTASAPSAQKSASLREANPNTGWSRQQRTLDTGTQVQEFVNTQGIVFAVAWQGPVLPDLNTLLGSYFARYARAGQTARDSRRFGGSIQINESGLVMQSTGRMRNFAGYAYVPALVPPGVDIDALLQ